jgi:hypothetical protein
MAFKNNKRYSRLLEVTSKRIFYLRGILKTSVTEHLLKGDICFESVHVMSLRKIDLLSLSRMSKQMKQIICAIKNVFFLQVSVCHWVVVW